jgi:cyclopropane-fatty-acyl-phospholipid synthase
MSTISKRRVAIIGGGVSGLSCAWHLHVNCHEEVDVHLFEAASRLGGHAYTVPVETSKGIHTPVDIGFMVFNDDNYPNMTQWFKALHVSSEPTDMSLSVSLDHGDYIEWSSNAIFAKKMQMLYPSFYTRFLYDMLRFNREAEKILLIPTEDDPRKVITVGQYLRQEGYSEEFATYYLLPMMAALWSASIGNVLNFPITQLVGFMSNHKMLQIFKRPEVCRIPSKSNQGKIFL